MPITRRMALTGLAASAVPLGTTIAAEPDIAGRCHDLAAELSCLLAQLEGGRFSVEVRPARYGCAAPDFRFDDAQFPAAARRDRGLSIAMAAMSEIQPGAWRTALSDDGIFAIIINDAASLSVEVA